MYKKLRTLTILIIILMIIYIVLKIGFSLLESRKTDKTIALSDYGVSITVPYTFSKISGLNSSHVLYLKDEDGIYISVTELKGDFWESRRH